MILGSAWNEESESHFSRVSEFSIRPNINERKGQRGG